MSDMQMSCQATWFARFAWFAWFANKTDPKFLAVYSANKLQFLHILEYCGMQGKYENRVKNGNKFFLEIPGLLSSKTEQEKSK